MSLKALKISDLSKNISSNEEKSHDETDEKPKDRLTSINEKSQVLSGLGLEDITLDKPNYKKNEGLEEWLKRMSKTACALGLKELALTAIHRQDIISSLGRMNKDLDNICKWGSACKTASTFMSNTNRDISNTERSIRELNKKYAQIEVDKRDIEQIKHYTYSVVSWFFIPVISETEHITYNTYKALKKYNEKKKGVEKELREVQVEKAKLESKRKEQEQILNKNEKLLSEKKEQINDFIQSTIWCDLLQLGIDTCALGIKIGQLKTSSTALKRARIDLEHLWKNKIVPCIQTWKNGGSVSKNEVVQIEIKLKTLKHECEKFMQQTKEIGIDSAFSAMRHGMSTYVTMKTYKTAYQYLDDTSKLILIAKGAWNGALALSNAWCAHTSYQQHILWKELFTQVTWVQEQFEKVQQKFINEGLNLYTL